MGFVPRHSTPPLPCECPDVPGIVGPEPEDAKAECAAAGR